MKMILRNYYGVSSKIWFARSWKSTCWSSDKERTWNDFGQYTQFEHIINWRFSSKNPWHWSIIFC